MNIGIIGYGNLGKNLASILHQEKHSLFICDRKASTVQELNQKSNIQATQDPREVCKNANVVFLIVKPKDFSSLAAQIAEELKSSHTVVSFMAGISLEELQSAFSSAHILRAMPNIAIRAKAGLIGVAKSPEAKEQSLEIIEVMKQFATVHEIDERLMDAFAALAGCGTGFVAHLLEGFVDAGLSMGFRKEFAEKLTMDVVFGVLELVNRSTDSLADVKSQVCAPGGMTIRGILEMDRKGAKMAITDGILKALKE